MISNEYFDGRDYWINRLLISSLVGRLYFEEASVVSNYVSTFHVDHNAVYVAQIEIDRPIISKRIPQTIREKKVQN